MNRADRALAARDPSLENLAIVLDPGRVVEMVAAAIPGAGISGAVAEYVRYKPGTGCLVGYRFETARGVRAGYVKTVAAASMAKLEKMVRKGAVRVGVGVTASFLPNDPRLPGLSRFGGDLARLLERLDCDETAEVTTLTYKPERRYVGLVRSSSGVRTVLRSYTDNSYLAAQRANESHPTTDEVATPRLIAKSKRHRAMMVSWLEGDPLVDLLHLEPAGRGRAVGSALRDLHRHQSDLRVDMNDQLAARVAASLRAVAWLLDDDRYVSGLERRWTASPANGTTGPIHGDFSADQVLVGRADKRVGVIDWDRAGFGEQTWDLASFLADLEARSVLGSLAAAQAASWSERLLEGYGGVDHECLRRATAAALATRAIEPFRRRHPNWDVATRDIIERALQLGAA